MEITELAFKLKNAYREELITVTEYEKEKGLRWVENNN